MAGNGMVENAAMFLATREKRLRYWRQSFSGSREIGQKLDTYALILAKLAKPSSDAERAETLTRLEEAERDLTELFEKKRMLTSALGGSGRTRGTTTPVMKPR